MNLKKEMPTLLIALIPFIYLAYIWNSLPDTIPTHWNLNGDIDSWGKKSTLIIMTFMLSGLPYGIFLLVPLIDPKKKIQAMGNKYNNLKFLMVLVMSLLSVFIIYSVKHQSMTNFNVIPICIGILYIILGNYMKTIKANYFIGIRTPWTLENESVWKKTHILAGKLWLVGGLSIIVSSLITDKEFNHTIFASITIIIALVPAIYSYIEYKKLKTTL